MTCHRQIFYTERLQLRLDKQTYERLHFISGERRVTMSEYIRGVVNEHMEKDAEAVAILKKLMKDERADDQVQ